ncbi:MULTISPECIES: hypothetical protein [unclassified Ensifer]|uniref:hypothetical protein n=1 Tax=unclassified Ensifer TaxID=2633371 RepID=UPI00081395DF|nr:MULTISPECIES: hypothetical protein [unclassified Ensifer]OCP16872.1 hypothetical protein BC363_10315 [Ensifer sp. LC384]OCP24033.1 hypothetical protein BC361_02425 [Ensifer sp. LC54]OCP37125.1 hypothetical protein BC360_07370 [Ensifer sp. LC163]
MFLDNLKRFRAGRKRTCLPPLFLQAKENRALMTKEARPAPIGGARADIDDGNNQLAHAPFAID